MFPFVRILLPILILGITFGVEGEVTYRIKVRSVQASSEQKPIPEKQETFWASNIIDRANWTRWSSEFEDRQWLVLDLSRPSVVEIIKIHWEDAYAQKYIVRMSMDGVKWKKVYQTQFGQGGIEELEFTSRKARYIRLDFLGRATDWGYSIWEIDIFGHR